MLIYSAICADWFIFLQLLIFNFVFSRLRVLAFELIQIARSCGTLLSALAWH